MWLDGLNIAYWSGPPPSLRLPVTLATGLRAAGYAVTVVFDASAIHHWPQQAALYSALLTSSAVRQVPSRQPADCLLLREARHSGGVVVSRDGFKDHRRRYRRLIDDPARRWSGFVRDDHLHLPALELCLPLPGSAEAAVAAFLATSPTTSPAGGR
jgi:Zc3h12a-like Ribonuclease NYN domain